MAPPWHRRLAAVHSAIADPTAATTTHVEAAERVSQDVAWLMGQGELDPAAAGLDAATLRQLMVPEPGAPTVTERTLGSIPDDIGLGAPPRPLLDADGKVINLEWLEGLRDSAVAAQDFRRASYINDVLEVVRPRPPLTLRDTAPAGVEAKAKFFLENGVCALSHPLSRVRPPARALSKGTPAVRVRGERAKRRRLSPRADGLGRVGSPLQGHLARGARALLRHRAALLRRERGGLARGVAQVVRDHRAELRRQPLRQPRQQALHRARPILREILDLHGALGLCWVTRSVLTVAVCLSVCVRWT